MRDNPINRKDQKLSRFLQYNNRYEILHNLEKWINDPTISVSTYRSKLPSGEVKWEVVDFRYAHSMLMYPIVDMWGSMAKYLYAHDADNNRRESIIRDIQHIKFSTLISLVLDNN